MYIIIIINYIIVSRGIKLSPAKNTSQNLTFSILRGILELIPQNTFMQTSQYRLVNRQTERRSNKMADSSIGMRVRTFGCLCYVNDDEEVMLNVLSCQLTY